MKRPFTSTAVAIVIATALAACGGGGGIQVPAPGSTAASTSATVTTTPSSSSSTTQAIPGLSGAGVMAQSITFPPASAGAAAAVTISVTSTPPSGTTGVSSVARAGNARTALAVVPSRTSIEYVALTSAQVTTFSGAITYTITLANALPSGAVLGYGIYVPGTGWAYFDGSGTLNTAGTGATFSLATSGITLTTSPTLFGLYYQLPSSSPQPTTTPTQAPTPTPEVVVSPSSLYFTLGSNNAPQTFTASESGYTGSFTESDTCTSDGTTYATVTGTSPTFTVTADNAPATASSSATCTITVSDSAQNSASVAVYVSQTTATVQSRGRR